MRERLVLGGAVAALAAALTIVAVGAAGPPTLAVARQQGAIYEIDYSPKDAVTPGGRIGIVGRCLNAAGDAPVETAATLYRSTGNGDVVATQTRKADPDGHFTVVLDVPGDAEPGPTRLEVHAVFAGDPTEPHETCRASGTDRLLFVDYQIVPSTKPPTISPMSITPTSGRPGTRVHIAGSGCPTEANRIAGASYNVGVTFEIGPIATGPTAGVGHIADTNVQIAPKPDGTWSVDLVVPKIAPPGPAKFSATCSRLKGGSGFNSGTSYITLPFTVSPTKALPITG